MSLQYNYINIRPTTVPINNNNGINNLNNINNINNNHHQHHISFNSLVNNRKQFKFYNVLMCFVHILGILK